MNKTQLQDSILSWVDTELYKSLSRLDKWILAHIKSERLTKHILKGVKVSHEKVGKKKNEVRVTVSNKNKVIAVREFGGI